ncbi:MAG: ERCC4 domain-containing protein [Candidatus Woesearchaeota archaeon]
MKIFIDNREKKSGIGFDLNKLKIDYEFCKLDIGDYLLSEKCIVERKTISDFLASLIDGRLFNQAKNLKDNFDKVLIIVEGDSSELYWSRDISENAIISALLSLKLDYGISVIYSEDIEFTSIILKNLLRREYREKNDVLSFRIGKRFWTLEEEQKYLIEGLPGVGPKLASALLDEFKTPEKIFNASEKDLQNVEKIGKKKAEKIKSVLEQESENQ